MSPEEPYDHVYWGPGGIDLSRWGEECGRGLTEHDEAAARARAARESQPPKPAAPVDRQMPLFSPPT